MSLGFNVWNYSNFTDMQVSPSTNVRTDNGFHLGFHISFEPRQADWEYIAENFKSVSTLNAAIDRINTIAESPATVKAIIAAVIALPQITVGADTFYDIGLWNISATRCKDAAGLLRRVEFRTEFKPDPTKYLKHGGLFPEGLRVIDRDQMTRARNLYTSGNPNYHPGLTAVFDLAINSIP